VHEQSHKLLIRLRHIHSSLNPKTDHKIWSAFTYRTHTHVKVCLHLIEEFSSVITVTSLRDGRSRFDSQKEEIYSPFAIASRPAKLKFIRHVYLIAYPFNQLTSAIHKLDRIMEVISTSRMIFCDAKQCSTVKVNFVLKFDLLYEFKTPLDGYQKHILRHDKH
jgi:hypothetical protein